MAGEPTRVLEIKASPEIERALSQQMLNLPQKTIELASKQVASSCFGLVVCCVGGGASVIEPALTTKPIRK